MSNKLELTWVGKNEKINIEPRILIEDKSKSYGDNSENVLIHGDNLLALKALENNYTNKIKCIYIDPPYNTGSAFEHYDDNIEHSIWLNLMKKRIDILKKILSDDGAICIQIDAVEMAYLKVIMDEIFGRNNFINIISVKTKIAGVSGSNLGKSLQDNIEYILFYAKDISKFNINVVPQKKQELMSYIGFYKEQGKSWKYTSVLRKIDEGKFVKEFKAGNGDKIKLFKHEEVEVCSINQLANELYNGDIKKAYYDNIDKIFRTTNAQTSIRTKVIEKTKEYNNGNGFFSIEYVPIKGKNAGRMIRALYKDNNLIAWLRDVVNIDKKGIYKLDNMGNLWDDIQYNNLTKEGNVQFPNGKKPEELVKRILDMTTNKNDIVLDSFLGSGTTCAVAQKMERRWIGIEMGDHCYSHCKVRLDRVIDGEDLGGITTEVNWKGGGGYKFYELAPSLINIDSFGEPVINKEYNAEMLAAAVALHEGFKYNPSYEKFWKQSVGNENSYLYVTTKFVTKNDINKIKEEMNDAEYLVIACTAYDKEIDGLYKNIKIKKIPEMLLSKCEFGKDNYNLNIINPPEYEEEYEEDE